VGKRISPWIAIGILVGALLLGAIAGRFAFGQWLESRNPDNVGDWAHVGVWRTNLQVGSTAADPVTRAFVARFGLLGLAKEETIYFASGFDEEGEEHTRGCTYEFTGKDPGARWWSITLYGDDGFLLDNGDDAYSMDKTRVARADDGTFKITISPTRGDAENWISDKGEGGFSLALRMYNPEPGVVADPGSADLPEMRKIGCEGEGA
tara:strand:+ start:853 stop:1473 length:621 start_codon:yes stop_codon:yes gene_type:complete